MIDHPIRTVLWQRLDAPGTEYCMLQPSTRGWLLQGDAVTVLDNQPVRVMYQIRVDAAWRTHRVAVDMLVGANRQRLHVVRHDQRGWRTRPANEELAHLRGCLDVDLSLSPVTNTLPIRRLNLAPGQSAEICTAWVRFPQTPGGLLAMEPCTQRYTRLDHSRYLYEGGCTPENEGFSAVIAVDDVGLVTFYEGGWQRSAAADEGSH